MRIASWNINAIGARLDHLCRYLTETKTDVMLLQELKTRDETFPREPLEDIGYNLAIYGQKSYNGVAIVSKHPLDDVIRGIPDYSDENARYISAFTGGVRVSSVYVPNGQSIDSDKYAYKMQFYAALDAHMKTLHANDEDVFIGGDFNVAPTINDIHDHTPRPDHILCSPQEQEAWRMLINSGYIDVFRALHPYDTQAFSWWDYRAGSWQYNRGYRIDQFLLNARACDRITHAGIDTHTRGWERPSDHAPIWVALRT
ncbi:MAG: exodeoxyribonuclease III [Alphaproteobacteria bacterium]|nr:MAG: exodeoxyribonuclease III [Alphaproteobacteria bacterium]